MNFRHTLGEINAVVFNRGDADVGAGRERPAFFYDFGDRRPFAEPEDVGVNAVAELFIEPKRLFRDG